ncbi:MAG TPA: Fe-S cluster assembly protein SufD [Rudaea sp.]|jgi:Fe-S cluster assembly protein SufD|uniref:Fe-S cluster assembly protein SufD n=1 Tax=Rudaea sp. TaxID=2136325 RepID=UPI002F9223FD
MNSALLDEFGRGDAREREESWRYSKAALRALSQQDFVAANAQAVLPASLRERYTWPHTQGRRLVFVNGAFSPEHSDISQVAANVALRHEADNKLVLSISADAENSLLHLVYTNVATDSPSRWQSVSDIHVHNGRAVLIEQHLGDVGADVLGALTSQIRVDAQADLQMTTLSDLPESVSLVRRAQVSVDHAATYRTTHAILGSRLQRFDLGVELIGTQARFDSRGVFSLRGRAHADTHLDIRHVARDTACDIVWRGVADQRARGVFHGAITVAAGADGVDAKLSNKNLLLSAQAEIDTQPVLEIYADEVKAAHGATVGQLDERALFYLRSRGIPLADAKRLLLTAFCDAVFDQLPLAALREHISALLAPRMPEGASA